MPFITEEIWQHIPHEGKSIMVSEWPKNEEGKVDEAAEVNMTAVMDTIKAIRNMRAEVNAVPGRKSEAVLHFADDKLAGIFKENEAYLRVLADAEPVVILSADEAKPENAMTAAVSGVEIYLPLKGLIDVEKETARLTKELENLDKEIKRAAGKLSNQGFVAKAPADVVEKERAKQKEYEEKKAVVAERLKYLATL
jgi:valyl-tRNA synthetase